MAERENQLPYLQHKGKSLLVEMFARLFKEKPLGATGAVIVLAFLLVGIFANFIAPYGIQEMTLSARLAPPSASHILGTDNLGRDLLSMIIYGARISMFVGLFASSLSLVVAASIGLISGYFGGKLDLVVQRFVDATLCFPSLFIYLSVMAAVGPGLWQVIIVLGLTFGVWRSRLIRSAVIGIKENVYVEAATAIGSSPARVLMRHILPNVSPVVIVYYSITVGQMILAEATLSFLGFGIPPPDPSWGGMLSGGGRQYMELAPWMALWPGFALALTIFGVNMLGDGIRDILDPRLRGGVGRYGVRAKVASREV